MRDRRHRTDLLLPRERQSTDDNNPFAPPPEGRPDQPWQPRRPEGPPSDSSDSPDSSGSSGAPGPDGPGSSGDPSGSPEGRSGWGSQWSSRQPGRSSGGGFGGRPGGQNTPDNGQQGPGGPPSGLRWDPTDPAQRRARYALLAGMWAFFFALFDFPEIALLLGALAVYWAISSLRAKPRRPDPTAPAQPASATPSASRSQRTSAVTGLVMATIALLIVASAFTAQLVYRDFYTCERDALTKAGQLSCNDKLPEPLRGLFGVKQ
ncbi:hypothetical protein ACFYT4_11525 [Streptomyces sp. NPDC004609]|uniref:hypothetical protein n=1 Tax=Streptomyces sp. NPDC004609 TaxID=3364704 RepID=UPI00368756F2